MATFLVSSFVFAHNLKQARHTSEVKSKHKALELNICPDCTVQLATHRCLGSCNEDYCESCFLRIHRAGALLKHKSQTLVEPCDSCNRLIARVSSDDLQCNFFCHECAATELQAGTITQTFNLAVCCGYVKLMLHLVC